MKVKSLRDKYVREHPVWPKTSEEAVSEISEINDLLDKGGWTKAERNWAYSRRKKLQRYLNDPIYRIVTGTTPEVSSGEGDGNGQ